MIADSVIEAIETQQITSVSAAPILFSALLERGAGTRYPLRSLRRALAAGTFLPDRLKQDWHARLPGAALRTVYSMSELHMMAFLPRSEQASMKPGCVGKPTADLETRMTSEGELLIRPPYRVQGYFNDPELTRAKTDSEGWFHTGDAFEIDSDGDFIFLGNLSDVINFSGHKVSPAEVENCLLDLAGIRSAKVVGMEHPSLGQIVVAAVVADPSISEEQIREHCSKHLSQFKVPQEFVFAEASEFTDNLKLSKQRILDKVRARWKTLESKSGKA